MIGILPCIERCVFFFWGGGLLFFEDFYDRIGYPALRFEKSRLL